MEKRVKYNRYSVLTITVIWVVAILLLPLYIPFTFPQVKLGTVIIHTDYLIHVSFFIVLVFLIVPFKIEIRLRYLAPILMIFAAISEILQIYIPHRTYNIFDLISNLIGVTTGIVVVWAIRKLRK